MPTLPNRDRDISDYRDHRSDDREISLGTGTILGIFFALALLCAVFFGFGYSMGRKSSAPAAATAAQAPVSNSSSIFSAFKPSAGSPISQAAPAAVKNIAEPADSQPPADPDAEIVTQPVPLANQAAPRQSTPPARKVTPVASGQDPASELRPSPKPPTAASPTAAMPVINPNGTSMVQVAAVSHQEDADVLLSALKKRGYAVFIRQEPQDRLMHVQVGPFANKKDAEAMRQRLLADGYNAIVK